jgi:hypothetical protein
MITPVDRLKAAIQKLLNAEGDGWVLDQFVIAMGLQRVTSGNDVESTAWVWAPAEQPDWITDGLLRTATELREESDIDTD